MVKWESRTHRIRLQAGDLTDVLCEVPVVSIDLVSVSNLPDASPLCPVS
jgi:hypothetical protein